MYFLQKKKNWNLDGRMVWLRKGKMEEKKAKYKKAERWGESGYLEGDQCRMLITGPISAYQA